MDWQPMETAPEDGEFLVAFFRPTSWRYHVSHVILKKEWSRGTRQLQLEYARGWMPVPPPPQEAA